VYLRLGVANIQRVLDDKDTTNQAKYTIWQPSAGAGLHIAGLVVDYAYTSLQTQSNPLFSHIISVRLDINKGRGHNNQNTPKESIATPVEIPQTAAPVVK
jgi:hypothetical protein